MSFWDMLVSHTKVAGGPLPSEQIVHPVVNQTALESKRSSWSAEQKQMFKTTMFITTCVRKLEVGSMVKATSCWLFHKFFSSAQLNDYDEYVVAMTCIFLAGKMEETPIKIRDVINVAYRTLHPDKPLLQIDETYSGLVDTLVDFELFLCRMLKFQLSYDYPHKYLLHYLKSLSDWISSKYENEPYQRVAWSILNDCYSTKLCIQTKPDHLALTACYMAIQSCGVKVHSEEHAEKPWWKVLIEDIRLMDITTITSHIMDIYENELVIK